MRKSAVNSKYTFNQQSWVVSFINTGSIVNPFNSHAIIVVEGIKPDFSVCLMSDQEADEKNGDAHIKPGKIYIRKYNDSTLEYAVYCNNDKEVKRSFISTNQLPELSELLRAKKFEETEVKECRNFLEKILQITSKKGHTHFSTVLEIFVGQYHISASPDKGKKQGINVTGIIKKIHVNKSERYQRDYSKDQSRSYYADPKKVMSMIDAIIKDAEKCEKARRGECDFPRYQLVGKNSIFSDEKTAHNCASWCNEKLAIAGITSDSNKPKIAASNCIVL